MDILLDAFNEVRLGHKILIFERIRFHCEKKNVVDTSKFPQFVPKTEH